MEQKESKNSMNSTNSMSSFNFNDDEIRKIRDYSRSVNELQNAIEFVQVEIEKMKETKETKETNEDQKNQNWTDKYKIRTRKILLKRWEQELRARLKRVRKDRTTQKYVKARARSGNSKIETLVAQMLFQQVLKQHKINRKAKNVEELEDIKIQYMREHDEEAKNLKAQISDKMNKGLSLKEAILDIKTENSSFSYQTPKNSIDEFDPTENSIYKFDPTELE